MPLSWILRNHQAAPQKWRLPAFQEQHRISVSEASDLRHWPTCSRLWTPMTSLLSDCTFHVERHSSTHGLENCFSTLVRKWRFKKYKEDLTVSGSERREFVSHYCFLTSKNLKGLKKNQQLFLDPQREQEHRAKRCPPRLETDKYGISQLTEAEIPCRNHQSVSMARKRELQ